MIVGALGDVVFSVSSRTLKTISNFVWSGSARYATHDLHAGNSISEYTGTDLAKITFDIQLLASLGVDPMSEIWRLFSLLLVSFGVAYPRKIRHTLVLLLFFF